MPTIATRRAAKFWVSLVGLIVTTIVASAPDSPPVLKVASAVLSALAVYLVPNGSSETDEEPAP